MEDLNVDSEPRCAYCNTSQVQTADQKFQNQIHLSESRMTTDRIVDLEDLEACGMRMETSGGIRRGPSAYCFRAEKMKALGNPVVAVRGSCRLEDQV
jgi:hypothetical protein